MLTRTIDVQTSEPHADERGSRLRILVVDDNADAASGLSRLLSLLGHEVRVVFDGTSALVAVDDFVPQIVLLDLGMPGMDGLETARQIRQRPDGAQLGLVAVTGWGQESDRQLTEEAGFSAHLIKPVKLEQLQLILARIIAA